MGRNFCFWAAGRPVCRNNAGMTRSVGTRPPRPNFSLHWYILALYRLPMIDWSRCPEVEQNLKKVSGAWVFRGSRVPVTALFENLEAGASIDEFLSWFPGITKHQVEAVLEYTISSLESERLAA